MLDDDLRIEDLNDPPSGLRPGRRHALFLARRLWKAWQGSRGPRTTVSGRSLSARLVVAGLTVALALTLVAVAGDDRLQLAQRDALGAAPVPIAASEAVPTVTLAGHSPMRDGSGPFESLSLPASAGALLWFAASPVDPATLFACTGPSSGTSAANTSGSNGASTRAWRSRDAGATWTSLALPALPSAWCLIQVARDAPNRVTVLADSQLYLSDDGGDSWSRMTLPSFPQVSQPGVDVLSYEILPTAHHLYVQTDYFGPPPTPPPNSRQFTRGPELAALARSDDNGRSWTFVGQPFGANIFLRPFVLGNENTLITSIITEHRPSSGSAIWLSRDAGATWTPLAPLDHGFTANLVTVPFPAAGSTPPVYAMTEEQIPSSLFRLKVQQLSRDLSAWSPLPPLPVADATPSRMGLIDIVGEAPDGRLLALGVNPADGVPAEVNAVGGSADAITAVLMAPWLWAWNPAAARWSAIAPVPPVPPPHSMCGAVCWLTSATYTLSRDGHPLGMYLALRSFNTTAAIADRIFLPDSGSLP